MGPLETGWETRRTDLVMHTLSSPDFRVSHPPGERCDWCQEDEKREAAEAEAWAALLPEPQGKILHDVQREGVRGIVVRGPVSLCAYLGVPTGHPLAGFDYDAISIDVHGGLTFSGPGGARYPEGWWWYGWDYAHAWDRTFESARSRDKPWTLDAVKAELDMALPEFVRLARLAERIHERPRAPANANMPPGGT